jgi:hypothetical protein
MPDAPLTLDPHKSALLVMDFQQVVVANFSKDESLLPRAAGVLRAARDAGVRVIHVGVGFRPGYPEVSPNNQRFSTLQGSGRFLLDDPGTPIHPAVAPRPLQRPSGLKVRCEPERRAADLHHGLSPLQELQGFWEARGKYLPKPLVGGVSARNPNHLRRRAESLDQEDEIPVLGQNDGPRRTCGAEDLWVFGGLETEKARGVGFQPESLCQPRSKGWRELGVNPDNQATSTG